MPTDGIKFPRYDGATCPKRWLRQFERVLNAKAILAEDQKLVFASIHLDAAALDWYDAIFCSLPVASQTFAHFKTELPAQFSNSGSDEALEEELRAASRQPEESVVDYLHRYLLTRQRMDVPTNLDSLVRPWTRGLGEPLARAVFEHLSLHYTAPIPPGLHPKWDYATKVAKELEVAKVAARGPVPPLPDVQPNTDHRIPEEALRQFVDAVQSATIPPVEGAKAARLAESAVRRSEDALHESRKPKNKTSKCKVSLQSPKESTSDNDDDSHCSALMAQVPEGKRKRGAAGDRKPRPRRKTTLDPEWLEYIKNAWSIPLALIQSRSKRQLYMQLILAIRTVMGLNPKPRPKPSTSGAAEEPKTEPVDGDAMQEDAPVQQQETAPQVEREPEVVQEPVAQAAQTKVPSRVAECVIAGGRARKIILDAGCTNSLMDVRFAKARKLRWSSTLNSIELANGNKMAPLGRTQEIAVEIAGTKTHMAFTVVVARGSYDIILGLDWLRLNRVIARFEYPHYEIVSSGKTLKQVGKQLYFVPHGRVTKNDVTDSDEDSDVDAFFSRALDDLAREAGELSSSDSDSEIDSLSFMALSAEQDVNINPNLSSVTKSEIAKLLRRYSFCFASDIKDVPVTPLLQVDLQLQENVVPYKCRRPRRLAPVEKEFLEVELKRLQDADVIAPWEQAAEEYGFQTGIRWLAPVTLVKKKSGSLRLCVCYNQLNAALMPDTYGLPRVDDLVDSLSGAPFYSLLDHYAGFHSLGLSTLCFDLTAFLCTFGTFVYKRLPFGLLVGPSCYQRLTDLVYSSIERKGVYLDDVCLPHQSEDAILSDLEAALHCCSRAHLRLNAAKCFIGFDRVEFLGFVLSAGGLSKVPSKLISFQKLQTPQDRPQLLSFLGTVGYYRRFIRHFSTVAAPLTDLVSPKTPWKWTTDCEAAFQKLKDMIQEDVVLQSPVDHLPFLIDSDASSYAIGGCLSQVTEDKERPIYFYSRKMTSSERNYSTTEREALAVIGSLKAFRPYVLGRPVVVRTDHAPLMSLFRKQDLTGRLARWQALTYEFQVSFKTRPGAKHLNADGLSRLPPPNDADHAIVPGAVSVELEDEFALLGLATRASYHADPWYSEIAATVTEDSVDYKWSGERLTVLDEDRRYKTCLSQEEVPAFVLQVHQESGHFDASTTLRILRQRYWFPQMSSRVHRVIQRCPVCQKYSDTNPKRSVQPLEVHQPWEYLQLDTVTGLPRTLRKNTCFVTAVDCFTGFVLTRALPTTASVLVLEFFNSQVRWNYGLPSVVITDNGSEFAGSFADAMQQLQIEHRKSTPYYLASHGKVEKIQKLLLDRLRKSENPRQWDTGLYQATFQVNTRVSSTQTVSPLELLTGVLPKRLSDMEPVAEESGRWVHEPTVQQSQDRLLELSCRRSEFDRSVSAFRQQWASNAPQRPFKAGDVVLVKRVMRGNKLEPRWDVGKLEWIGNKGACTVNLDGQVRRVHLSRVKSFFS